MILADLLYTLSQHTLISDSWAADIVRYLIAVISSLTAILLAKLYVQHRTGKMGRCAAGGAIATYAVVSWAQIIAVSSPTVSSDLTALNLGVLFAVSLSLTGTFQAMNVHLFKSTEPHPGRISRALSQLDHMSETMDANADKLDDAADALGQIDHAVNNRHPIQPTISEDVRNLVDRAEAQDRSEAQDQENEK